MKIEKFEINNYRTLVGFKIDEFEPVTVLYGENNAGKSNVLNALVSIFARKKKQAQDGTFSDPENFYEGVIGGFANNFYDNHRDRSITFDLIVSTAPTELIFDLNISGVLTAAHPMDYSFRFTGEIISNHSNVDLGEMLLRSVVLNGLEIYKGEGTIDTPDFHFFG